jgi:addiction module HigA family antidote
MSTSSTIIEELGTMRMKNPPHPGQMIGDSLEELGLSVSEAARGLGVTRQQLHNVIAGRSAVSPEMAVDSRRHSAARRMRGCECR